MNKCTHCGTKTHRSAGQLCHACAKGTMQPAIAAMLEKIKRMERNDILAKHQAL